MKHSPLAAFILAACSASATAAVTVKDPWVHATASYQKSTVAFMQLTSSADARLVRADSPVAKTVEIHEMAMKNHVMQMKTVAAVDLPAGKTVELKPNGFMVMLSGLKQQIKEGDSIPISIVVEGRNKKRETIALSVPAMTLDKIASDKHLHASMQEDGEANPHAHGHAH